MAIIIMRIIIIYVYKLLYCLNVRHLIMMYFKIDEFTKVKDVIVISIPNLLYIHITKY